MKPDASEHSFVFLTPGEAALLEAIAARIIRPPESGAPTIREAGVVETIDRFVYGLAPEVQRQLRWALRLFRYGPLLFSLRWKLFHRLSSAEQDAYLRGWANSRLALRRIAFRAIRNLVMLGYYAHESTWPMVGYQPTPRQARGDG